MAVEGGRAEGMFAVVLGVVVASVRGGNMEAREERFLAKKMSVDNCVVSEGRQPDFPDGVPLG